MKKVKNRGINKNKKNARRAAQFFVRTTPGIKAADAYKALESWRSIQIKNIPEEKINSKEDLFKIPTRSYYYEWFKEDIKALQNQDLQQWVQYYTPQAMHNNKFWNNPYSPYKLGIFEKEYLNICCNKIMDLWFSPLGINPPLMTVSHAVWICILINTQPYLLPRYIDVWLFAEYFSSLHLEKMQDNDSVDVTPTSNPINAIDKSAFDYINSTPWKSQQDFQRYKSLVDRGVYKKLYYTYEINQFISDPQSDEANYRKWEMQFPMLYASQIPNMESMPPIKKALRFLSRFCLEILGNLEKNGQITDYKLFNQITQNCNDISELIDTEIESNPIKMKKIQTRDLRKENTFFSNHTFNSFYRLMINLSQFINSDTQEIPALSHLDTVVLNEFTSIGNIHSK